MSDKEYDKEELLLWIQNNQREFDKLLNLCSHYGMKPDQFKKEIMRLKNENTNTTRESSQTD